MGLMMGGALVALVLVETAISKIYLFKVVRKRVVGYYFFFWGVVWVWRGGGASLYLPRCG
jgi:hypothetical protein